MTETRPTTVPDVLDAAADVIERQGWMQGAYGIVTDPERVIFRADGPVCAVGAINTAMWGDPSPFYHLGDDVIALRFRVIDALDSATAQGRVDSFALDRVVAWNDYTDRTRDEVVAAFRAAAERERKGGAR